MWQWYTFFFHYLIMVVLYFRAGIRHKKCFVFVIIRKEQKIGLIRDLSPRTPIRGVSKTCLLLSEDLRKDNAMFQLCELFLEFKKCILIGLPLLSMCRQAILLNVFLHPSCNIDFPPLRLLMHGFMIASFLGQYSIIKSSVSATIAYWSLLCYVKYTFSELVSFRPCNALLCVLFHEEYL